MNARLRSTISKALACEEDTVTRDSGLGELPEWDSLGHLAIILAIEEEFGLELTDEQVSANTDAATLERLLSELNRL